MCKTCLDILKGLSPKGKQWDQNQHFKIELIDASVAMQDILKPIIDESYSLVNLTHEFVQTGGDIRVMFDWNDGNWSYVGTDNKNIPSHRPTMNIANWNIPKIVKHEFGHKKGLYHEQQHPNRPYTYLRDVVIKYMAVNHGWSEQDTIWNILAKKRQEDVIFQEYNKGSLMEYDQPGIWFTDGIARYGGETWNEGDIKMLDYLYPNEDVVKPENNVPYENLVKALFMICTDKNRDKLLKYDTVIPVASLLKLTPPRNTDEDDIYEAIVKKLDTL